MKFYEIWGRDTFANETFLCEKFQNRELAERLCRKYQDDANKTQPAELRDSYCIIEISAQEIEERNRKEELKSAQIRMEQYYDRTLLQHNSTEMLQQFRKKVLEVDEVVKNSKEKILVLLATHELNSTNPDDCYSKVKLELKVLHSNSSFVILPELTFKSGEFSGEGTCSKAIDFFKSMDDVILWLNDERSPEILYAHLSKLIEKYYDD